MSGFVESAATRVAVGAKAYASTKLQAVKATYEAVNKAILEMPDDNAIDDGSDDEEELGGVSNNRNRGEVVDGDDDSDDDSDYDSD